MSFTGRTVYCLTQYGFYSMPMHLLQNSSYGGDHYFNGAGVTGCDGPITVTLNWVADANEDPPLSLIVSEQCSLTGWSTDSGASFTADTGLPNAQTNTNTSTNDPNPSIQKSSAYYWVKNSPGQQFTINCSPSVSASPTSPASATSVSLQYRLLTTPVEVHLKGVTLDNAGNQHILIGQGCTPELKMRMPLGGIFFDNYAWTIGGDTFKSYVAHGPTTGSYAQVSFLTGVDLKLPAPYFFWRSEDGGAPATVSATADAFVGNLRIGTVTGKATVTVWCPYYFCGYNADGVWLVQNAPGSYSLEAGNLIPGISWTGRCIPQDLFAGMAGAGLWAFIQIMHPGRWYTMDDGVRHSWYINGLLGLDTSYPYPFWEDFPVQNVVTLDNSNYGKPDDDSSHASSDTPSKGMDDTMSNVTINEEFWTYMVYRPADIGNGNQWVPLHRIHWSWAANVNRVGNFRSNNGLPLEPGPVIVTEDARCKTHPIWNRVFDAPNSPYIP